MRGRNNPAPAAANQEPLNIGLRRFLLHELKGGTVVHQISANHRQIDAELYHDYRH